MDYDLSEESRMFQNSIRSFAQKEIGPLVEEAEEKETFPVELFPKVGDLGYLGIRFPEKYGGSNMGKVEECIFMEEVGYVSSGIASAFHPQFLACLALYNFGTEEQKQRFLIPAIKGEKIMALGITEPNAGSDVGGIETTAKKAGGEYILNGSKMFITNGNIADCVFIVAYTDKTKKQEGIGLFIAEKGTSGFSTRKLRKMTNMSADLGEVILEDCRVPGGNILGEETGGFQRIMETLFSARITHGARSVGLAQAAYDAAFKYAQERRQFGKPIGKFQAVKFKLAQMAIEINAARLLVYKAAWLLDQGRDYVKDGSMAKVFASEMAQRAAADAMHIHGGYGYMMEFPVQRYFRDAKMFTVADGTTEIQRSIIARELGI